MNASTVRRILLICGLLPLTVAFRSDRYVGSNPDYWVYFQPGATDPAEVERRTESGKVVERLYMTVGNNGSSSGSHSYRVMLRVWQPSPPIAVECEVSFVMQPFEKSDNVRRVAAFEVVYRSPEARGIGAVPLKKKVRPGRYQLQAGVMEQVPVNTPPEDTYPANNAYPFQPPYYLPVGVEVRDGAEEIRCIRASGSVTLSGRPRIPGLGGGSTGTGGGAPAPPPSTSQVTLTANPASPALTGNIAFQAMVPGNSTEFTNKFTFSYQPQVPSYGSGTAGSKVVTIAGQGTASWAPSPQPVPDTYRVGVAVETRRTSSGEVVGNGSKQITGYDVVSDPQFPYGWFFPITTQNAGPSVGSPIGNASHAIAGMSIKKIVSDPNVRVRANNTACAQCHGGDIADKSSFCTAVPKFDLVATHSGDVVLRDLFRNWKQRNCPD